MKKQYLVIPIVIAIIGAGLYMSKGWSEKVITTLDNNRTSSTASISSALKKKAASIEKKIDKWEKELQLDEDLDGPGKAEMAAIKCRENMNNATAGERRKVERISSSKAKIIYESKDKPTTLSEKNVGTIPVGTWVRVSGPADLLRHSEGEINTSDGYSYGVWYCINNYVVWAVDADPGKFESTFNNNPERAFIKEEGFGEYKACRITVVGIVDEETISPESGERTGLYLRNSFVEKVVVNKN